jgi:hypothetical protein
MEQIALNDLGISNELEINKLFTENGAYIWPDRVVIRAHKHLVDIQKGIDRRFPLADNWWRSYFLIGTPTDRYFNPTTKENISESAYDDLSDKEPWKVIKEYQLDHASLRKFEKDAEKKSILNDIRLVISGNDIEISLSGILTSRAYERKLKLFVEIIQDMVSAEIVKGNWRTAATWRTSPYRIIREHFYVAIYEVRIDSGRYGKAFIDECRRKSQWTAPLKAINQKSGDIFNQVQFYSPEPPARRKRGFDIVCYDRSRKPENRKADPALFPYRMEVKLYKRFLEGRCRKNSPCVEINDLLKGKGVVIIDKLKTLLINIIESGVHEMKAERPFDLFINNKKRSGKTVKESIDHLLNHGTMLDKVNYCLEKTKEYDTHLAEHDKQLAEMKRTINKLLIHHGTALPHQRGLKVV